MVLLQRTVRFNLNATQDSDCDAAINGYAGWPALVGIGAHQEVTILIEGEIDSKTNYLMDIKRIDQQVRRIFVPALIKAYQSSVPVSPVLLLKDVLPMLDASLDHLIRAVRWSLSPYHEIEMAEKDQKTVLMRQQFDFSASHRLCRSDLSETENYALYGKCANPNGHGHNYRVEPCVRLPVEEAHAHENWVSHLARLTNEAIIEPMDHKYLNLDCPAFDLESGVMPSVENISRICYAWLDAAIQRDWPKARLESITVWETDRTCCTFPG